MQYISTIFNRDFETVVKRYKTMRSEDPRAYGEAMLAFQAMADGTAGPAEYVAAAYGPVPVHTFYFNEWEDAAFLELLVRLSKDRSTETADRV